MSKENYLKAIEKFWPKDAPKIENIPKIVSGYSKNCKKVGSLIYEKVAKKTKNHNNEYYFSYHII